MSLAAVRIDELPGLVIPVYDRIRAAVLVVWALGGVSGVAHGERVAAAPGVQKSTLEAGVMEALRCQSSGCAVRTGHQVRITVPQLLHQVIVLVEVVLV